MTGPSPARKAVSLDVLRRRVVHGYPGDEDVAIALDVVAELSGEDSLPDAYWWKWCRANGYDEVA